MKRLKKRWKPEEDAPPDPQALERSAVGLLTRREHSRVELQRKLSQRGFVAADIENLLDRLAAQRLQSDERFTESYVRMRKGRGYGPQRIRAELRERGVADALVEQALGTQSTADMPRIDDIWQRKFSGQSPQDYRERARQMRFLQQRGFSTDEIQRLFDRLGGAED